jgi:hypothetical protein
MFPSSSQGVALGFQNVPQVLNVFPNMFPIAIHFLFHIVFGQGSRYLYISCKGGGGKHDKTCFYFGEGSIFRLLYWGVLHVSTILVMGQSNGSF